MNLKQRAAKRFVLREYPGAWYNSECRTIEGYSSGLILGRRAYARPEGEAWLDAARNIRQGKVNR